MSSVVSMNLPADVRCVRVVSACVVELLAARERKDPSGQDDHDILLAVQEACMNIVDHAYNGRSGRIALDLILDHDRFTAEFKDTGEAFDPTTVKEPDLEAGQVRGYGIFLMKSLLDDLSYTTENGENHWRLVKRFTS